MYSTKDGNFFLFVLATLCILGYGVSSWEACPTYIPHYCACEITDQAKSTRINMCSYEIDEGMGCKPCPSDLQDYANCTSCPGKTCPVCAPDEFDMQALQKSVSLDTFEDLKKIGKIATSYSLKLADNSSIIYRTGEEQSTRIMNATEDDQSENEQIIYDKKQTAVNSSAFGDVDNSEEQIFDENQSTRSFNLIKEDLNRNGFQIFERNQTSRNKNTTEEDQNNSEINSSENDRNTTDQYFSDEDYGLENINYVTGEKEKDDSYKTYANEQQNDTFNDQQLETEANLNHSLGSTNDRLMSKKYGDESYRKNNNGNTFIDYESIMNATEDDQNENEQIIFDKNQTAIPSSVFGDADNSEEQIFDENQGRRSFNLAKEDLNRNGFQIFEKNPNSRNKNTTEEDQNYSEINSSEQNRNTTDQYFSDEDYGLENINYVTGEKEKDGSYQIFANEQQNSTFNDKQLETEANLNHSLGYTNDRLMSKKYGDVSYRENENGKTFINDEIANLTLDTESYSDTPGKYIFRNAEVSLGLKSPTTDKLSSLETARSDVIANETTDTDSIKIMNISETTQSDMAMTELKETDIPNEPSEGNTPDAKMFKINEDKSIVMKEPLSSLFDQILRQPYLQTEIQDEGLKGEKTHYREDIKQSDAERSMLKTHNFQSTSSSTSIKEMPTYSSDSLKDDTVDAKTSDPLDFALSSPEEMYFLRGDNSKNHSSSKNIFNGFANKLQFENKSSEFEKNYSRNVTNDEKNNKTEIEKENKLRSKHLAQTVDKDFIKNNYVKDVINNVFYDERNSIIQTLAFDVIFVNYLKYSTGMSDLTTFYFLTDLSPEEKVDINLVRICFLNQNYFTVTASELNLCRKEMFSIPDSSSLLTVRVQNSHIFKEFNYNIFDEESEHTGKNQTLHDESSLSKNDGKSNIFNGHDYKLLRKGAKKFVNDNFDFRKLYDLWEMPENESSETYRFCEDINLVRVCKNYEDDVRVYLKIDDRFHIFVSAFLDSATLLDLHAAEFVEMQLSKHNYLMPNINAEPEEKEKTDSNNQTMNFMEMESSTSSYNKKHIGENKSLQITDDGFVESSKNLTEDSQNEFGNEKTFISFSNSKEKFDFNRSNTSKALNLSSSIDPSTYNFSDETGNKDEVSLSVTMVSDTNEDEPSGMDGSLTDDDYIHLEQDDNATRPRRAPNATKHSPDAWCNINKRYFNGSITCDLWTYKKECTIHCYPGYDFDGEKSKQFTCQRKSNAWVPELTSCLKGSGYMNTNEGLDLESDTDEVMKSQQEAKYENAHVPGDASTSFKDKSPNLLSNYHAPNFDFDNYAYDKYNYDSPSDEYE